MNAETIITYAGWAGATVAAAMAFYERFRNRKLDESRAVAEAKDALVASITGDRDAWKSRSEATTQEYADYRQNTHKHSQECQAKILTMTEEVSRLRNATDITPLLRHTQEQTSINTKILATLDMIQEHLREITPHRKIPPAKEKRKP